MKVLRAFKGRVLESILIIAAVAVAAASVTVVSSLLASTAGLANSYNEGRDSREITLQLKAEDYNAFYLSTVPTDVSEVGPKDSKPPKLELADLAAVKAAAPTVTGAYLAENWGFNYKGLDDSNSLGVFKITSDFQTVVGLDVSKGSLLSASDFDKHNRVMLISPLGIKKLKLKAPVVGQKVTFVNDGAYTIVGVIKQTDKQDDDDYYEAFIPWAPLEWDDIRQLTFSVAKATDVPQAQSEIRAYADKTWGETVSVRSNAESYRAYFEQQRTRNLIVAVFASLGLATAALSIMSLMLARVLRRHREIGVLRSLGATQRTIRNQFLGEALMLGVFGSVFGVAAGYGLYAVYRQYMIGINEFYGDFLTFSPLAALGAFGLALFVSLLFGLYPAILASRVSIVSALKEA